MKNKSFLFLIILLLIIIIVVSVFSLKGIFNKENIETPNNDSAIISEEKDLVFSETGEKFGFRNNVGVLNNSLNFEHGDYTSEKSKVIRGITYTNINNATTSIPSQKSYTKATLDGGAIILSNKAEFKDGVLFENDIELLPQAVYLEKEMNIYYLYNGILYFVPVIKCNKDDERIEYRNGLTIMKNTGSIIYNNNIISNNYNDEYSEIDLENIFYSYFLTSPDTDLCFYKLYEVPNINGCVSVITYNGNVSRMLLRANDESVDVCNIPMNIAGNVGNYDNLFYQHLALSNIDADQDHQFRLLFFKDDNFIVLENY